MLVEMLSLSQLRDSNTCNMKNGAEKTEDGFLWTEGINWGVMFQDSGSEAPELGRGDRVQRELKGFFHFRGHCSSSTLIKA